MRGVYAVRSLPDFEIVHEHIDELLDRIPAEASHLLTPETNILHYLRIARFKKLNREENSFDKPTIKLHLNPFVGHALIVGAIGVTGEVLRV
jgi:hypothetical protein